MHKPELLAPAGDMEKLEMALLYGADAVYLAGREFGMRAAAENFDREEMRLAITRCHNRGVKVYVTANTMPRNQELQLLPAYLAELEAAGADAVIVADMGVFRLARLHAPGLAVHISTQAGIVNFESARFFYEMGARRVILARELSFPEIAEIREKTPSDLELEAFVHGSMCVSFSGRCLLSNYMTGRDANRGECAQPCRYRYALVEGKRPGKYFPVFEDGEGTHIMNSKDLCMIGHIPELTEAGISSFKIEGRMKSSYYAAVITQAYRMAMDAAAAGREPDPIWLDEVEKVSHRPYHTGFYYGPRDDGQYHISSGYIRKWDVTAFVTECDEEGNAILTQRNRFFKGDTLELVAPGIKPISFTVTAMRNKAGETIDSAPHPEMAVHIKLPCRVPAGAILRRAGPDIDSPA